MNIASAQTTVTWNLAGKPVAFKLVDKMLVNDSCKDCEALKVGREFGQEPIPSEWLKGGKNPFSVRCSKVMKGEVLIGFDKDDNQNAFCYFKKDGSYMTQL